MDPEGPSEPFHLHGHTFRLLSRVHSKDLPPDPPVPIPTTPAPPEDVTIVPGPSTANTTTTTPPPPPPLSLREKVVEWDKRSELVRGLQGGLQKDTVSVPPGGYTIVRFTADNPGMYCSVVCVPTPSRQSFCESAHVYLVLQFLYNANMYLLVVKTSRW